MFYDFNVDIYNKAPGEKIDGIFIPGVLEKVNSAVCDIQPYSTTLLIKQYGYDIEVNKRIFMDADVNVRVGTVFYYTNPQNVVEKYEVKVIIGWDYLEVACLGI